MDKIPGEPVRILQVTDLHLGSPKEDKWNKDLITYQRIKKLVETYDPDMLIITGDLFDGNKPFGNLLAGYAVNFFDSFDRPWLFAFGNHDPEGGFGRADIARVFAASKWGILGKHPVNSQWKEKYDYLVHLKYKGIDEPVWQLFGFDSGSEPGNKSIKSDQLTWFKEKSEASVKKFGNVIPAASFFHIPLLEFQYLKDDPAYPYQGISEEDVYFEEDDGSVYQAFLDQGNMKAVFCGHDHYNNYWGKYKGGILLSYGFISGEATNYRWPPGGKLILLPTNGGEIELRNVSPEME